VDPEDEEVDHEGEQDETPSPSQKVPRKIGLEGCAGRRSTISSGAYESRRSGRLTMLCPFLISRIPHRSHKTAPPTVMNVKSPTILHPRVQARKNPVAMR